MLLGCACLLLQQVTVGYRIDFGGDVQDASLVHLHVGLLLAIALLDRDRWVLAGATAFAFAGWCVRQSVFDGGPSLVLLWGAGTWLLNFFWMLACARWIGWPRAPHRAQLLRSELPRLALVLLLVYPLGRALISATVLVINLPVEAVVSTVFQTFFAKQFGVAVLTLPLMLAWTESRRQPPPGRASLGLRVLWPLLMLATMALSWWGSRQLTLGFSSTGALPPVLMDYRFMLFLLLAWLVVRLPLREAMLALSSGLLLLVAAVAGTAEYGNTALGFLNLLHIAVEVNILLVAMLYLWMGRRDRLALSQRLSEQALRNSVTGLPNLRALQRDLNQQLPKPRELGYLLLDHADSMVHGFGVETQTEVMRTSARKLQAMASVYYMGTGQFVLVAERGACDWEQLIHTLEAAEMDVNGQHLRLSPYLGVAPLLGHDAAAVDGALRAASHLAFDARRRSDVLPRYAADADLQQQDWQLRQLHDTGQALDSLRRDRISLYFQPIVPLHGRGHAADKLCGEVLCRLFDEAGTLIPPPRFMAPIEASGRGAELDLAVVRALRGELERNPQALAYCGRISVNLTGQSVASPSFRSELRALLAKWPLPLSTLCFEITETAAIASTSAAIELLEELRAQGCRIAIDDFGTGMQSFTRLKELPLDEIKIDGSFIRNITQFGRDHALVQACVAVAEAFGAETVAEFVENAETEACLRAMGVDWVQGHLYGAARPLAQMLAEIAQPVTGTADA
ncbi:bifunctional diguanylate cyclase/phosphodiesterase [Pseudoxanthomonas sp. GM95]|uniref:EAL domain-containing protein n=1 Tax=Pseudoxanthomonas sp. GM95 TaxID=1881043 RepID=UPI001113C34F|nr:bifunctional diguanylate cyclase/phosphodiesterase [Pseudoxanthomonas sp. GM95]